MSDDSGYHKSEREARARLQPDQKGRHAWDDWETQALSAGLDAGIAELGLAVMRASAKRGWSPQLQAECGWQDRGRGMLALALTDRQGAAARWQRLLDTDGERQAAF